MSTYTKCPTCGRTSVHTYYDVRSGEKRMSCFARIVEPGASCNYYESVKEPKRRKQ